MLAVRLFLSGALRGPKLICGGNKGMKLTYVEGWKAINLANEVFGFHGWSSSITTLTVDFVSSIWMPRFRTS